MVDRRHAKIAFVGFLLLIFATYSYLSLDMIWTSGGGNIGAGFFPRIIGFLGVTITGWILLVEVRKALINREKQHRDGEADKSVTATFVIDFSVAVVGCISLIVLLRWVGLYASTAFFLLSAQAYLKHRITWPMLAIALVAPILLFLLMVKFLGIDIPLGLLSWL